MKRFHARPLRPTRTTQVLICVFIAGFAWSWGPIVWVLGAEIQSLQTRTSGMSAVVLCNYLLSFVVGAPGL